jgi:hypothetical protein
MPTSTSHPDSVLAVTHTYNNGEGVPLALATPPVADSVEPIKPTLLNKSDELSVDASTEGDEDHTSSPCTLSIWPPVDFVLGNFFLATFLISLVILIVSFIVTWFTVLRDARSMNDRVLSNATGVSLCPFYWVNVANACCRGR